MSTPDPGTCDRFEAALPFLAGIEGEGPPPAELRELEAHREACPRCARAANRYRRTVELLRALPRRSAPPDFLSWVRAETTGARVVSVRRRRLPSSSVLSAAALFVVAAGVGLAVFWASRPPGVPGPDLARGPDAPSGDSRDGVLRSRSRRADGLTPEPAAPAELASPARRGLSRAPAEGAEDGVLSSPELAREDPSAGGAPEAEDSLAARPAETRPEDLAGELIARIEKSFASRAESAGASKAETGVSLRRKDLGAKASAKEAEISLEEAGPALAGAPPASDSLAPRLRARAPRPVELVLVVSVPAWDEATRPAEVLRREIDRELARQRSSREDAPTLGGPPPEVEPASAPSIGALAEAPSSRAPAAKPGAVGRGAPAAPGADRAPGSRGGDARRSGASEAAGAGGAAGSAGAAPARSAARPSARPPVTEDGRASEGSARPPVEKGGETKDAVDGVKQRKAPALELDIELDRASIDALALALASWASEREGAVRLAEASEVDRDRVQRALETTARPEPREDEEAAPDEASVADAARREGVVADKVDDAADSRPVRLRIVLEVDER